ncbi:MAG TPA: VWA domain-containing protein, partial [Spirochaetia bacterium]|nr:VWA domain-containing protein [Spirochaetia bacterium]
FVEGNGHGLRGRPNDRIGLVTFARYADTICPLTLDHRTLEAFLQQIHLPVDPQLDGTAIGDGIALAAAHLKALGSELAGAGGRRYHVKSKVIILLTDGQNNFGRLSPTAAAELAKRWGIQIYTIGIGDTSGPVTINTILGPQRIPGQSDLNTTILERIAAETGGQFQIATNGSSLESVYRRIDKLQKSRLKSSEFVDWRELYLPFVLTALGLILLEVLVSNTLLRRIP